MLLLRSGEIESEWIRDKTTRKGVLMISGMSRRLVLLLPCCWPWTPTLIDWIAISIHQSNAAARKEKNITFRFSSLLAYVHTALLLSCIWTTIFTSEKRKRHPPFRPTVPSVFTHVNCVVATWGNLVDIIHYVKCERMRK
jgi:hypothetical protein